MKYLAMLLAVIAITGGLFAVSCSGESGEPLPTTRTADPTEVIGEELMLSLQKAKNFHRKARVYMSNGELDQAIAAVREILAIKFPAGAPEAEDVRNDARALLAKLLLGQNKLAEAMTVVKEGIAQSQRESFFVANLHTMKGEIHEAEAAALDPADPSKKAKLHEAIESYDKSNEINTKLQNQLMRQP